MRYSLTSAIVLSATLTALAGTAQAVIITDFSNFHESGNLLTSLNPTKYTRDQDFSPGTPGAADVTITYVGGADVGQEVFLSDEFPTMAAGDRISVDWGGTGTYITNEAFGLAVFSAATPTTRTTLFTWTWQADKDRLRLNLANFDDDGAATQYIKTLGAAADPDTLFIERTASGWSFGSITGGAETIVYEDITTVGGKNITADGSAVGLWSDMRSNTSTRILSNLDVSNASSVVAGDTNGDDVVDAADYIAVKRHMGDSGAGVTLATGDIANGASGPGQDGKVDWYDLQLLVGEMGGTGGQSQPIPEPASLCLLALGAMAVTRRRSKS